MKKNQRIERQRELIEEYGMLMEDMGYQPVTARIAGMLLIMDKEIYTFDEIVSELNISKSTASVAIKNLLLRDVIEYTTLPGDRKRYFRTKITSIDQEGKEFINWLKRFQKVTKENLELKEKKESRVSFYIKELITKLNTYIPKMEKLNEDLT